MGTQMTDSPRFGSMTAVCVLASRTAMLDKSPVNVSVLFYHDMHPDVFVPDGDLCTAEFPPDTSDVRLMTHLT
jgi:hypothetical protein